MYAIGLSRSILCRSLLVHSRLSHAIGTLPARHSLQHFSKRQTSRYSTAIAGGEGETPAIVRPRSYVRRIATFFTIAILSTAAGLAMSISPVVPIVDEFLSPPSDAETCTMFQPSTDKIAKQEAYIQNHPLVLQLRSNPDFVESRPHMKIPAAVREHHLTAGALAGPGKLELPPLQFVEKSGKEAITVIYIGTDLCGHRGLVHGGAMATLLDESLARCCFQALPNKVGMTANLNINYRKPLPAGSFAMIRSVTTKVEGRKAWVEGTLENLPVNGESKEVYCEANALFIEPKQAAMMAQLYSAAA